MAKRVPREFLGAFKCGHRVNSKEFIDEELSAKLLRLAQEGDKEAEETLLWLSKFNNEFHKDLIRKDDPQALHKTDEQRRDCHKRNYDRRYDLYTSAERVDLSVDGTTRAMDNLVVSPLKTKK